VPPRPLELLRRAEVARLVEPPLRLLPDAREPLRDRDVLRRVRRESAR
jgi:hypothetical protein